jgi:signal transduction histidine kinase
MKLFEGRLRPVELLRYAGMFTWLCAAVPLLLLDMVRETPLSRAQHTEWWILHGLFGVLFWNILRYLPGQASLVRRAAYLLALTGCALGVSAVSESPLGGILLLILAGLLPWLLTSASAFIWLIVQSVLLAIILGRIPEQSLADAALSSGLFLGMSLFAFMGSLAAVRQQQSRDELRKLNSELRATQALLTENTRIAERVRIARDLHDVVGHHLTALTLNLQVAAHLVEGKALEHVQQAHSLAKLLLADVREVVSDMRRDDKVDLAHALQMLADGVPQPRIHLDLPSVLVMTDPQRAQLLLRCAQEIITNSVRHAGARNLWIRLSTRCRPETALTACASAWPS